MILERGTWNGVEYCVEYVEENGKVVCRVKCPKCGEYGNLQLRSGRYFERYRIVHGNRSCSVTYLIDDVEKLYERLVRIRRRVRMERLCRSTVIVEKR